MAKILVCQHVPHQILGTLDPLFKKNGFRIRYANFSRFPDLKPDLQGYNGLVLLGGPMNVDETHKHPHLNYEIKLIEMALKKDIPILGICLGAQLIAKTLGAPVSKNHEKEIGWHDVNFTQEASEDPLFKFFEPCEKLFQWHGYAFETPKSAVRLAKSALCPNQAFRYGSKVYGLQFHLEVDKALINRWLTTPMHCEELKQLRHKPNPEQILEETDVCLGRLNTISQHTFGQFIKLFGDKKKRGVLPSR
ncbi:type 1 glutamine amidotransferase [bacterium]|nr:type 1 glutamine amidotransferase [bacterium]